MYVRYKHGGEYVCNHLRSNEGLPGCQSVRAERVDAAVADAFLAALAPAELDALSKARRAQQQVDAALRTSTERQLERKRYAAALAERQFNKVDPDNRLVARGLEAEWEKSLRDLETAKAELTRREQQQPRMLGPDERVRLLALGADLHAAWKAPTTSPRDKKELLRTALEEVIVSVQSQERRAHLTLRWRGGALTRTMLDLPRRRPAMSQSIPPGCAPCERTAG